MTNRNCRNYLLRTALLVVMTAGCAAGAQHLDSSESAPSPTPAPKSAPAPAPATPPESTRFSALPPARGPVPAWAPPYAYLYARAANITYVDEPTPSQRETISWAVARFAAAGLQLPDLEVRFPATCKGKGAIYHVGESSVDFCRVNRKNVLHEFAHAWDDTSGDVDRAGFLQLRGLDIWFGGLDVPCEEQGSEHLAVIIAWGLMDPGAGSAHGLPRNSDAELTEAFEFLTHRTPDGTPTAV